MTPTVSVVMPVYNEEAYITATVSSLQQQDYPAAATEWVFVDGCSTDRTVQLLTSLTEKRNSVKILSNPARLIAQGMNIGIRAAAGEYIVRMDAHAEYAADYISMCIKTIRQTQAAAVGGPMVAAGTTPKQRAIAAAMHSRFALGGHKDHDDKYEGYADAVYYGTWRKDYLVSLGLFNEKLEKAEDDDLFYRIRQAGGKIYITPKIKLTYYPRKTFKALWQQYYAFGYWKMAFLQTHGRLVSLSQLVPSAFVLFGLVGTVLSFIKPVRLVFLSVMALYLLLDLGFSLANPKARGLKEKAMLLWAHLVIHVSYGTGGLRRLFVWK